MSNIQKKRNKILGWGILSFVIIFVAAIIFVNILQQETTKEVEVVVTEELIEEVEPIEEAEPIEETLPIEEEVKAPLSVSEKIHFESNSNQISAEEEFVLEEVITAIQESDAKEMIEIQGHTSKVGSETYNMALSIRRAEMIRDYLIEHGVDEERLTIKGFGETQPLIDGPEQENSQENRRVTFRVYETQNPDID